MKDVTFLQICASFLTFFFIFQVKELFKSLEVQYFALELDKEGMYHSAVKLRHLIFKDLSVSNQPVKLLWEDGNCIGVILLSGT